MGMKRLIYLTYTNVGGLISRTGIARRVLSLSLRNSLGRRLRGVVRWITALDPEKAYEVLGHRMYLDPGMAAFQDVAFGTYERDTVKVLQRLVKPGMTVVDVGACVGFYTLLTARLVGPNGRVYAFEPNPRVFALLCRNIEENRYQGVVRPIPKAVSNRKGWIQLYIPRHTDEASLYSEDPTGAESVEVETIVLGEFFAEEGWPEVHIIKIDVEGAEVEVLEGMRELVRKNPALKLIVEFAPEVQIRSVGDCEKLFDSLADLGFHTFYALRHRSYKVSIPQDIKRIIKIIGTTGYINLLCEGIGA